MPEPSPAAIARHPHLAEPRRPGFVRVDMHSHTMWSGDSTTTPDELHEAVAASGIDILCITDHHAIVGAGELLDWLPCRVIVGEEIRTHAGEIIGLGLTERIPIGLSPRDTAKAIRDQGAVVYVPHPFDPKRRNLSTPALDDLVGLGLVDALEVRNAKTDDESLNDEARRYAEAHSLLAGAGSDAHVPDAIGAVYAEMPDFDHTDPRALLAALAHAVPVGHHFDQPRPWRARIVPSVGTTD